MHLTGLHVDERRTSSLVGLVDEFHPRAKPQWFSRKMRRAASPDRCIGQLIGPRLGERDEFAYAAGGDRRTHDQHVRERCEERDGRTIAYRIVTQLRVFAHVDGSRRNIRRQQGIAVRCGACDALRADVAAATGAVDDDDRLIEAHRQPPRDAAHDDVTPAACGKGVEEAHRTSGIGPGGSHIGADDGPHG